MAHRKARGSVTLVGTNVLHTDDQRPAAVEAVVVGRSRTIVGSAASVRSAKLCSVFWAKPESSAPKQRQTGRLQDYMVDGPGLERRKHYWRQCTFGGYKRGPVATGCVEGRIAAGCRLAGTRVLRSIGIDTTWWRFAKRRDSETCATWRLRKSANISSLCRLRRLPAQRCSHPVPRCYHIHHFLLNTVCFLRSLSYSGPVQG